MKVTESLGVLVQLAKTALMDFYKTPDQPREALIDTTGFGSETTVSLNRKRELSWAYCIISLCNMLAVHNSLSSCVPA
jgi:hypothetical protein